MQRPEKGPAYPRKILAALCTIAIASSVWIVPTLASAKETVLEEVIVTARKRQEILQDVPIAVSAFTGKQMQREGINNLADFNTRVPNIELQNGNGVNGEANIYIRGVGQRESKVNIDSGVGIYLDGVYLARASGALLDITDVESVQVLRGPQGTLFGKNTTGGAIVINTRKPTDHVEGFARVRYGNLGLKAGEAAFNVPLVEDKLFTRLSLSSVKRDGFMKNLMGGPKFNDEDRIAGIWKLRWLATDSLTVDFEASYDKTDQQPRGQKCVFTNTDPLPKFAAAGVDLLGLDYKAACQQAQNAGDYKFASDLKGGYRAKNTMYAATVNWEISDQVSLKSITAWRKTVAGYEEDLDATGLAIGERLQNVYPAQDGTDKQYSQEFTLTGNAVDDKLHYVAGLYGFYEEAQGDRKLGDNGNNAGYEPTVGPYKLEAYILKITGRQTKNLSTAAYGQFDFAFTDWFTVTAGARYTWEKRKFEVRKWRIDPNSVVVPGSPPGSVIPVALGVYLAQPGTFRRTLDFIPSDSPVFGSFGTPFLRSGDVTSDAWTPMASAQFFLPQTNWMDSGNIYFTYSEGYRSGGLAETGDTSLAKFKPEKVKNYEIGFKGDFFTHRLRTNLATFYTKYDDQQVTSVLVGASGADPVGTIVNAGSSTIKGIEMEITALPIDNLQISFNASFNEGKYDKFKDAYLQSIPNPTPGPLSPATVVNQVTIDRSDEDMPRLPDRTYFIAAQYTFDTSFGQIIPRVEYSRKENISYHFDRASWVSGLYKVPHQSLTNARLTWVSPRNTLTLTAWVKNLTGEKFYIGGVPFNTFYGGGGVVINDPRTYGMDLTYRW